MRKAVNASSAKPKANKPKAETGQVEFSVSSPFNFRVVDRSHRIIEGQAVWDNEYLRAASLVHNNRTFHAELELASADLANSITKENYDSVMKSLEFIRNLITRFEQLHELFLEQTRKPTEDNESVQKSSLESFGTLEYPVDLQV